MIFLSSLSPNTLRGSLSLCRLFVSTNPGDQLPYHLVPLKPLLQSPTSVGVIALLRYISSISGLCYPTMSEVTSKKISVSVSNYLTRQCNYSGIYKSSVLPILLGS